jgi:transglutaminase-like putative cysteine protease
MTEEQKTRAGLAAAAATATCAAALGLVRLVSPGPWVICCLLVTAVIAASGVIAHRFTQRKLIILPVQVVAAALTITVLRVPGSAIAGFLPGPAAVHALSGQFSDGLRQMKQYAPPTPSTDGITTILVLACAGFALIVDALAVTFQRVAMTGLPLLAVYLIPATRAQGGLSWLSFALVAFAYLTLVGVEGRGRLGRWGRAVGGRQNGARTTQTANPHAGPTRRIASIAVGVALVTPWFIPTLPGLIPKLGGDGTGQGPVVTINQDVDLRASLTSTTPIDLLRYTTDSPDPREDYLQMSIDDKFDGDAWTSSSPSGGPETNPAAFSLADPGLADTQVQQTQVTTHVNVTGNLAFGNIPAPYAAVSVTGLGLSSYDPATDVMWAAGGTSSRENDQYTVRSIDAEPTAPQLQATPPPTSASLKAYTELPADLPDQVRTLAQQITANSTGELAEADALQHYFTSNFTYSLSVPAGSGNDAIERFLNTKEGFCEQFAGTMAAMARSLGIPAVVAVGFTPGEEQSDGSFVVTTHDAHAWPMLYFTGIGWVRFEPTPTIAASGRGETPEYSVPVTSPDATASAGANASANPLLHPSDTATACANLPHKVLNGQGCDTAAQAGAAAQPFSWLGPFGAVPRWFHQWFLTGSAAQIAAKLAALVLLLLAIVPGTGRLIRRRRRKVLVKQAERYLARAAAGETVRIRTGSGRRGGWPTTTIAAIALAAWDDLRECADDLGYPWPESDTPRQSAERLSAVALFDEDAQEAIGRVTTLTEQARYGTDAQLDRPMLRTLPADLRTLRSALAEHANRSARIKAAILPSSSLMKMRERRDRVTAELTRGTELFRRHGDDREDGAASGKRGDLRDDGQRW